MPISNEDLQKLMESTKARPVSADFAGGMEMLLKNGAKYLDEANVSGDIAPFIPKMLPLQRRVMPGLLAHEISSVQPLQTPTSEVYAIRSKYSGSATTAISKTAGKILVLGTGGVATASLVVGDQVTSASGAQGTITYIEGDKIVVTVTTGTFLEGEEIDKGGTFTNDGNEATIDAIFSTETAFKQVLKNYSGAYSTADGEFLGDAINEIAVSVDKKSVTATTRRLKANYSLELLQDLRSQHGVDGEAEMMKFLEFEIGLDIDQEILATYKANATAVSDAVVGGTSATTDGRWNMEHYAGLYQKILKVSQDIAFRTRRGSATHIVTTPGVIAALQALGKFTATSYDVDVKQTMGYGATFAGTLEGAGGIRVYRDLFATEEYVLALYNGTMSLGDSGVIYAPYQPIQMVKATDATTLQPVLGFMSRSAITTNILDDNETSSAYSSIFSVTFDGPLT